MNSSLPLLCISRIYFLPIFFYFTSLYSEPPGFSAISFSSSLLMSICCNIRVPLVFQALFRVALVSIACRLSGRIAVEASRSGRC
ncbi:hypothetical protein BKA70DRAFT_1314318 [Coprinopsis sp. MPI-PUGE-AT-0042]|nr:hypothetical protein BKA70DRAFT_1314318 [Coprinopsis sp. MPI-PUGE-AT-0042]